MLAILIAWIVVFILKIFHKKFITSLQPTTCKNIWKLILSKLNYSFALHLSYLMTTGLLFDIGIQIQYYDDLDKDYNNVFGILMVTVTVLYLSLFYYFMIFKNMATYGSEVQEKNKLIHEQVSVIFEMNSVNSSHFGKYFLLYQLLKKVLQISLVVFFP